MTKVGISYSVVKPTPEFKIFGIQVAILNLLRAYLRYGSQECIPFLVRSDRSQAEIEENARLVGIDTKRLDIRHDPYTPEKLDDLDAIFRVDPMAGDLFKNRTALTGKGFAFCGLAHAIAGYFGGQVLEKFVLEPSAQGDAIICPSRAIQSAVQSFFDQYDSYIGQRLGVKIQTQIQLPIIPLGVDLERFEKICTPDLRAQQRKTLDLGADDIAVLWVGRMSAAVKAHPVAMFRALEQAALRTQKKIHFLMVGYFAPPQAALHFGRLALEACPHIAVHFIPSDDPRFPSGLWAAGDIFMSLIDNIQESFGLTPIEAIAAGLPRVLSDWDGYRDCAKDGEDGFLVRTLQPPPGFGHALSQICLGDEEIYADYLAKTALCTAIDIPAATNALVSLIENPDLRRRMASKAKRRLPDYNWKNIIPAYENLWREMALLRQQTQKLV